jgi:ribosome-associated protein
MILVTPTISLEDREIIERFVRASGPGGQNINKVATAVELRFDIARSSLPDDVKTRLKTLGGRRVTEDGLLVIDSRVFRSQARNREAARERLIELIRKAARRPRSRKATRPRAAAREARITEKKRHGELKVARSRGRRGED